MRGTIFFVGINKIDFLYFFILTSKVTKRLRQNHLAYAQAIASLFLGDANTVKGMEILNGLY